MQKDVSDAGNQRLVERLRTLSSPLQPESTTVPSRLCHLEDIRAVLFDVYGTMFVSGSGDIGISNPLDNDSIFRAALKAVGIEHEPQAKSSGSALLTSAIEEAHAKRRRAGVEYPEVDILAIWQQVLSTLGVIQLSSIQGSKDLLQQLALEYECRVNPVWPMPGLSQTLERLRKRGLLLGIVSNAQFYTPLLFSAFLDATHIELGFAPPLCAWSYQILEAKPSTRLFRPVLEALAQQHSVLPTQTLYVGNDRLKDIWPAQQLGCKTALFVGDKRSLRLREDDFRLSGVEPNLVLSDLRQLMSV